MTLNGSLIQASNKRTKEIMLLHRRQRKIPNCIFHKVSLKVKVLIEIHLLSISFSIFQFTAKYFKARERISIYFRNRRHPTQTANCCSPHYSSSSSSLSSSCEMHPGHGEELRKNSE